MILKECPFCGEKSAPEITKQEKYIWYWVKCACGATGAGSKIASLAADNWNERHLRCDTMTFEAGQTCSVLFLNDGYKNIPSYENVHILHVLPSVYEELKLIVYKFWDRGHAIWIEKMCTDEEMTTFIKRAKKAKDENN